MNRAVSRKAATRTTDTTRWTADERDAMKERAKELKAEGRRVADRAEGERDLLAKIDEGSMWPTSLALTNLTAADEAEIAALVAQAVA